MTMFHLHKKGYFGGLCEHDHAEKCCKLWITGDCIDDKRLTLNLMLSFDITMIQCTAIICYKNVLFKTGS